MFGNDLYGLMCNTPDWQQHKSKILQMLQICGEEKEGMITDFYLNKKPPYHLYVKDVIAEPLKTLQKQIGYKIKDISHMWFQTTINGQFHPIHNHGQYGYSAVMYIDYDQQTHQSTRFVLPYHHPITGRVIDISIDAREGSIFFFPSQIPHYQPPNKSNKPRTVISMNIEFKAP